MIEKILIKNFATIFEQEIDFYNGFSTLTGETGAGKSIIIDALGLLLGNRSYEYFIRNGQDSALIQGIFSLEDKEYIISRTINKNGRNTIKINGEIASVKELNKLGRQLVKISAQFDNQQLLDEETQFNLLNDYARNDLSGFVEQYNQIYPEYADLRTIIMNGKIKQDNSADKIDFLKFQLNEIKEAEITENEINELESKEKNLSKIEKDINVYQEILNLLENNGVTPFIDSIYGKLVDIDDFKIKESVLDLKNIKDDLSRLLTNKINSFNFDESRYEEIKTRLEILRKLERKYKKTSNELILFQKDLEQQIRLIEQYDEFFEENQNKFNNLRIELIHLAEKIHEIRSKKAKEISSEIQDNLKLLLLDHAKFEVRVIQGKNLTDKGYDLVQFYISTNPGQDLLPLDQVASGGEISRVLLAISKVFANVFNVETLIFDEIDTGVSGRAAYAISNMMREIAKTKQVISITHLPQVAANSDFQYEVEKVVENNQTFSNVNLLDEQSRIESIAKLLSGDLVSESAINNAMDLLNKKSN
ncbi:MAG: DNA repair protein RecN [Lactobacillaceae bacterium]|jgi:DNA repair protein RecN (Recombination protein N)|nr:DNA repair protein RecN [Lactobacillaceae bacterium]